MDAVSPSTFGDLADHKIRELAFRQKEFKDPGVFMYYEGQIIAYSLIRDFARSLKDAAPSG